MTRRYLVIYENGPENMSGFAPDIPGCASTGRSLEEMRANLREALEFHMEGLALDGQPLPPAITRIAEIPVGTVMSRLARARGLMREALMPSNARPVLRPVPRSTLGGAKQ